MIRCRHIYSRRVAVLSPGLLLIALIQFLLFAPTVSHAHGPFDNSIHATLGTDGLEVSVVIGSEAAKEILKRASPEKPVTLDGMGLKTLPGELTSQFIEVKSGATALVANKFTVVGDGLEYLFTATFPKPANPTLTFRAPYFDALEQMKPGTLILAEESGKQIGSGLLTKGSSSVELTLQQQTPVVVAATDIAMPVQHASTPATTSTTHPDIATESPSATQRSSFRLLLLIGIPLLGIVWLVVQRQLSKPAQQR